MKTQVSNVLAEQRARRLRFEPGDGIKLTHYLFRYPAKFHPPVVRSLIYKYTKSGDVILDPFCGSGTLLVEAGISGRSAIGVDVDPLAVFITRVKIQRVRLSEFKETTEKVLKYLRTLARPEKEYIRRRYDDITAETAERTIRAEHLLVPDIPNRSHWFRRYVVIDLGRILTYLHGAKIPAKHRQLLLLCFASIIRSASNADPVPVSGLEVTSHMKKRDSAGRIVNPFDLFKRAVQRAISGVEAFQAEVSPGITLKAMCVDAKLLSSRVKKKVDAVITSPPYNSAVDYYRRHQLEMFWLGLTETQEERLALRPHYIGRDKVGKSQLALLNEEIKAPLVRTWETRIRRVNPERADAFKHYVLSMSKVLQEISTTLKPGGRAVFVLGESTWNGQQIPTRRLFIELAAPGISLVEHLWYPVINRYMSYSRHNGANIDREYVLVFEKKQK